MTIPHVTHLGAIEVDAIPNTGGGGGGSDSGCDSDSLQTVLNEHNARRAEVGAGPLVFNAKLTQAAQNHTDSMVIRGELDHDGFPEPELSTVGYTGNAGQNTNQGASADDVTDAYMASTGHRIEMLKPEWTQIGIGCRNAGGMWWTMDYGDTAS